MPQLGKVAEEAARFLKLLSEDLATGFKAEDWIAVSTRRGSLALDIENDSDVPTKVARAYNAKLGKIARYKPGTSKAPQDVPIGTLVQFAKIGSGLEPGQSVEIGVYQEAQKTPRRLGVLSGPMARLMLAKLGEVVQYYGSTQGRIHSVVPGASPAFFQLRDLATTDLIRCEFKPEHYDDVVRTLHRRGAVVLVAGNIFASREHRSITRMSVERIEECGDLSSDEFEGFFGSAPDLTGSLSTEEFIDLVRRDE